LIFSPLNVTSQANDIAIITLDAPVSFSKSIAPVCLPAQSADPDQYADQEAAILGWGGSFGKIANSSLIN
jgi:hypothetical protein